MNKYLIVLILIGCTSISIDNNKIQNNCQYNIIELPSPLVVPIDEIESSKSYKEKYNLLLDYSLLIKKQNDKLKTDIKKYNEYILNNCNK